MHVACGSCDLCATIALVGVKHFVIMCVFLKSKHVMYTMDVFIIGIMFMCKYVCMYAFMYALFLLLWHHSLFIAPGSGWH